MQSQVATRFRRWATELLYKYVQKGFAMDDDRLREGGNRYFKELLQRIRDISALKASVSSFCLSVFSFIRMFEILQIIPTSMVA